MKHHREFLQEKIINRTACIGIIGMGYVGLPLALAFCGAEYSVTGFDIDEQKCNSINQKRTYIEHIPAERYGKFVEADRFKATSKFEDLNKMDVVLICVPTPLDDHHIPDMSYIHKTTEAVANNCRDAQLIILESSTYPGTTREILSAQLANKGYIDGENIFIAFSPEREDPSNPEFTTRTIPKVVGADNHNSRLLACAIYEQIIESIVPVSSSATAEATKLTENIFRAINIALVNELKVIYDKMGIDIWEVIDAASTKPFGYMPFYPGPGLGGHCIPIDPFYLSWKAREYGLNARFIELAGEINTNMPLYVIDKLTIALSDRRNKSLKGSKILLVGVAYKKNVDDDRESPAYKIMDILEQRGAVVEYHDPHVEQIGKIRKYPQFEGRKSVHLTPEQLQHNDAVLIITNHEDIDYAIISEHSRVIVDTRNVMSQYKRKNIVKA